jgi:D-beta-D-heptose 7-phosphate kinase/D-beta-D-heptose 1-phosphate adenosyltransferase
MGRRGPPVALGTTARRAGAAGVKLALPSIVDDFEGRRVLVLGDAVLDVYLRGDADRLCREAPVPTVVLRDHADAPGAAANAAANLARLGASVTLLTVVGDDGAGERLAGILAGHGVDTSAVVAERGRATVAKHRLLADGQMLARFDEGSLHPPGRATVARLLDHLDAGFERADAVLVSDYGLGTLPRPVRRRLGELQRRRPRLVALDAHDLTAWRDLRPTVVKPNYDELLALLGLGHLAGPTRAELVEMQGARVLDATGAQVAAVTLDGDGAVILQRGQPPYRTYARAGARTGVAGAGDTYLAAFTLSLAAGAGAEVAAEVASAAAGIVVEKDGTALCSAVELREALHDDRKEVASLDRLRNCVALHRQRGHRLVFTNGCFDILHPGHISYLNGAKAQGDVLIVGVNGDRSVARLKGAGRPINRLEDRVRVLAALSSVDHVVPFDGDTPLDLVDVVRPDVFVKGGDYTVDTIPEAARVRELGGEVRVLPYVEGRSTTGIIGRAASAAADG